MRRNNNFSTAVIPAVQAQAGNNGSERIWKFIAAGALGAVGVIATSSSASCDAAAEKPKTEKEMLAQWTSTATSKFCSVVSP
jgi:hypothetical protein